MKRIVVAQQSVVPPGTCRTVEAGERAIAVCNVEGSIYALDNTCPHAGGPLGQGHLQGHLIVCPWHRWRYDVRTGERPENPEISVACYTVELEGDAIAVWLPEE